MPLKQRSHDTIKAAVMPQLVSMARTIRAAGAQAEAMSWSSDFFLFVGYVSARRRDPLDEEAVFIVSLPASDGFDATVQLHNHVTFELIAGPVLYVGMAINSSAEVEIQRWLSEFARFEQESLLTMLSWIPKES